MKTRRYWVNRYNDFCNKILAKEIIDYRSNMEAVMNEIEETERFYKEETSKGELSAEETVVFCYINHELNLLDPIGFCYPQISNEYASYAWNLVQEFFKEGKEKFPSKVKAKVEDLADSIGYNLNDNDIKKSIHRIIDRVNEIYNRMDFAKKIHKEHFSEELFWDGQIKTFRYKVLGSLAKEYAASISFLQDERDQLFNNQEATMKEDYEDYIQFLYINHHLNRLDPKSYYPQFPYQYEKYARGILNVFKNNREEFSDQAEEIIVKMYMEEKCPWKGKRNAICFHIDDMKKQLVTMNQ